MNCKCWVSNAHWQSWSLEVICTYLCIISDRSWNFQSNRKGIECWDTRTRTKTKWKKVQNLVYWRLNVLQMYDFRFYSNSSNHMQVNWHKSNLIVFRLLSKINYFPYRFNAQLSDHSVHLKFKWLHFQNYLKFSDFVEWPVGALLLLLFRFSVSYDSCGIISFRVINRFGFEFHWSFSSSCFLVPSICNILLPLLLKEMVLFRGVNKLFAAIYVVLDFYSLRKIKKIFIYYCCEFGTRIR